MVAKITNLKPGDSIQTINNVILSVDKWKDILHLEAWEIEIDFVNPTTHDHDSVAPHAQIRHSKLYDTATMRLNEEWMDWDNKTLERNIIHELLHLKLRDLQNVTESIEDDLHPSVAGIFYDLFDQELEKVIDRTAQIMYSLSKP